MPYIQTKTAVGQAQFKRLESDLSESGATVYELVSLKLTKLFSQSRKSVTLSAFIPDDGLRTGFS